MRSGLSIALLLGSTLAQSQTYEVQELTGLPGVVTNFGSQSLAADGTVGLARYLSPTDNAVTWRNGSHSVYQGFGSHTSVGGVQSQNLLVGTAWTLSGGTRAALWQNGTFVDLGSFRSSSSASAVNASGMIGGSSETPVPWGGMVGGFVWNAFVYMSGTMIDLGSPSRGNTATISSINSIGQAVGYDYWNYDDPGYRSFIWTLASGRQYLDEINRWQAIDINDSGQIVGKQYGGPSYLRQPDGTFVSLGDGSYVNAINNQGDIIGYKQSSAVLWRAGSPPVNINDLLTPGSPLIVWLSDINDSGQILARTSSSGGQRYVLLNPVPEPTSFVALFAAVAFAAARTNRRALK